MALNHRPIFADKKVIICRLCIKVGQGQGDGEIGTRVVWGLGTWDTRRRTWGHQVWDAGTCGTGRLDVKYRGAGTSNTGTRRCE